MPDFADAEKVLQTKMTSPNEVIKEKAKWVEEKGDNNLVVVPGKVIFTVKAGSARKKTRLVVRGN